jgi:hypothetical protein
VLAAITSHFLIISAAVAAVLATRRWYLPGICWVSHQSKLKAASNPTIWDAPHGAQPRGTRRWKYLGASHIRAN